MSSSAKSVLLFLLVLCSLNFFEFQAIKGSLFRYIQFGYLFIVVIMSVPFFFQKGRGFVLPVQLISFSIFLSIFFAWFSWGQSLRDCLGGTILSLVWFVFFYLRRIQFPIAKIEKIVVIYGVIYLILYFFQLANADKNYFIDPDTIDLSRGIVRIVFPGRGVFYLTIFIAINKLTTSKNNTYLWAALGMIGVVVTIMQVTRQFIFATVLIYLFHFLKGLNIYKKILLMACVLSLAVYISQSNHPIIVGLRDTQVQTMELGSDYVRVQAAYFYLTDYSYSTINRIFGNGVAYGETSVFYNYTAWYIKNYGYWLSDVGLVAVYAMFGIVAIIGYLLIWIKSFTLKVPKEFFYLKYYLWFLLLTCLTSDTVYSPADLITTVLVVYIYQVMYERQNAKFNKMHLRNLRRS